MQMSYLYASDFPFRNSLNMLLPVVRAIGFWGGVLGDTFAEEAGVADILKFFWSEVVASCSREIRGSDV